MSDLQIAGLFGDNNGQGQTSQTGNSGQTGNQAYVQQSINAAMVNNVDPTAATTGATGATTATGLTDENAYLQALEKFDVPESIREKHRELIELIVVTKSMDDEERQYWFHIMPIMTVEQIEKLRNILLTEQQKLAELNKEYSKRVLELNEQYVVKLQEQETTRKRVELQQAEAEIKQAEEKAAEDLLDQLGDI